MVKYKTQIRKKFQTKSGTATIRYFDSSVCVSFDTLTHREAWNIGAELRNQMVCQRTAVEWNGETDLWLEQFDFGLYCDPGTLGTLLVEVSREYDLALNIVIR